MVALYRVILVNFGTDLDRGRVGTSPPNEVGHVVGWGESE